MNKIQIHILISTIALIALNSHAAGIQKWVDDTGHVFYGDTPPPSADAHPVKTHKRPANPGKALPRLSVSDKTKNNNDSKEADPKTLEPAQAKEACDRAKSDLAIIKKSSRVQIKGDDGAFRFMTKAEIAERETISNDEIENYCR